MRDDEIRGLLRDRNPWWRASLTGGDPTRWTDADGSLTKAESTGIEFRSTVLDDVEANGGLWILRGPRRVGKSVALKRLAAQFCASNDPTRLIFMAADTFELKDLRRAFSLGRALTSATEQPRLWLIDEVTSVPGWERLIKELRDNTELGNDGVVLTGSSAAELQDATRALGAGRTRVVNPFRTLLPMTFAETLSATRQSIPLPTQVTPDALQTDSTSRSIEDLAFFADDLDMLWQRHLETGGFPQAVGSQHKRGDVDQVFANDLLARLSTDVMPGEPSESVIDMIAALHRRSGSPFDLKGTAEHLHSTRDRFRARMERLVASFGAIWCHQVDDEGVRRAGSQSKLYLADPLIARLPSLTDPTCTAPDFTRASEAALAVALARAINELHPTRYLEQRAVGYLRTGSGGEIDFSALPISVGSNRTRTCPVESKWVSDGWRSEARSIAGKYGRGILATKNITDLSGPVWAVPAPVLALLLKH